MKRCAKCDFEYDDSYDACPQCARAQAATTPTAHSVVDWRMPVGLVGAALLVLGAFLPVVSLPLVGNVTYFNNGKGDGVAIVVLALVAAALIGLRRFRWAMVPGGLSLGLMLITFMGLQQRISEVKASMTSELAGNPFAGLATGLMESVQMQWGWVVLGLGALLVIAAGLLQAPEQS